MGGRCHLLSQELADLGGSRYCENHSIRIKALYVL
jgi:hypothetical protein